MARLRKEDVMAAAKMKEPGCSVRGLAKKFGVDESSLRYRLVRLKAGAKDGRGNQPEACEPYAPVIRAWMDEQSERVEKRHRPEAMKRLYELLVMEHGYGGSYKAVVRYVNRRRPKPKLKPVRRVEVRPGSQSQVDWLEVKTNVLALGSEVNLLDSLSQRSLQATWRRKPDGKTRQREDGDGEGRRTVGEAE